MNRRSLLDYLANSDDAGPASVAEQAAALLEQRLAELESKLIAARSELPVEAPVSSDHTFSSQIETILRGHQEQLHQRAMRHVEHPQPPVRTDLARQERQPAGRYSHADMQSPPLAADLPGQWPERSAEFTKFVEAVHLIGQAAHRFLQEPAKQAPVAPEISGPSQDTVLLTSALKETIAAFQAMTSDLASAASEIRRATEMPRPDAERRQPRHAAREDIDFLRLQAELDDLRERLGSATRRRTTDNY